MTLDEAKISAKHRIGPDVPRTLEWLAAQCGAEKSRNGRYSKRAFKIYTVLGRALQALKRDGEAAYRTKTQGGPGWVMLKRYRVESRAGRGLVMLKR